MCMMESHKDRTAPIDMLVTFSPVEVWNFFYCWIRPAKLEKRSVVDVIGKGEMTVEMK